MFALLIISRFSPSHLSLVRRPRCSNLVGMSLTGPIPPWLGKCTGLTTLYVCHIPNRAPHVPMCENCSCLISRFTQYLSPELRPLLSVVWAFCVVCVCMYVLVSCGSPTSSCAPLWAIAFRDFFPQFYFGVSATPAIPIDEPTKPVRIPRSPISGRVTIIMLVF